MEFHEFVQAADASPTDEDDRRTGVGAVAIVSSERTDLFLLQFDHGGVNADGGQQALHDMAHATRRSAEDDHRILRYQPLDPHLRRLGDVDGQRRVAGWREFKADAAIGQRGGAIGVQSKFIKTHDGDEMRISTLTVRRKDERDEDLEDEMGPCCNYVESIVMPGFQNSLLYVEDGTISSSTTTTATERLGSSVAVSTLVRIPVSTWDEVVLRLIGVPLGTAPWSRSDPSGSQRASSLQRVQRGSLAAAIRIRNDHLRVINVR
ncbi:hypothetical protein F0562_006985 [Nyssa sinensis]|uniref:Uncharacterized protein n=1 Tax=Nyssa sinensis TaxID=561372 RepID=A0A5J5A6U3_9ASTE|nr:hypothetical protein F0562_006985 [Nyssa sinensis]